MTTTTRDFRPTAANISAALHKIEVANFAKVAAAAQEKFGEVYAVIKTDKEATRFFVACKRRNPAKTDYAYMTITSFISDAGEVSFHWGHYDLDILQLYQAVGKAERA